MAEEFYPGETFEFEHNGTDYIATIERDEYHGAPWSEECGHGPVTDWTTCAKAPGQMVLNEHRGARRYYDFQEACKIALRDGWGWLPEPVRIERPRAGGLTGAALPTYVSGAFRIVSDDPREAHSELYRMHRESMSARAYAAGAALRDFERLRGWCNDSWCYVGVVVRRAGDCARCGDCESLWGIESDAGDYIRHEVAPELAQQLETSSEKAA